MRDTLGERDSVMASSNRTPLLGQRSAPGDSAANSAYNMTGLNDRLTHTFTRVFTLRNLAVVSGPVATAIIFAIAKFHGFSDGSADSAPSKKIGAMLGALVWMAVWWVFEPVPIGITSLLPLVLFPFFEIMDSDEVAAEYFNDIVVLMLGTFILAVAINKYDLHKRMALRILLLVGGKEMNPRLVLLGFIGGPAFVSMWMSNTSAAAMMLPMATGLLQNVMPENHSDQTNSSRLEAGQGSGKVDTKLCEDMYDDIIEDEVAKAAIHKYSQGVVLGVTYGVGLGGMATLIGCGPNLMLPGIYRERFPDAPEISFLNWMAFAVPLVILWLVPLWLFLCWKYCPLSAVDIIKPSLNRNMVVKNYNELGAISFAEIFTLVEFCILVVLWITRSLGQVPGWSSIFHDFPGDGTVAVAAAVLLFVVPNGRKTGEMLLNWKNCKEISWSVILLLGAGFALSKGVKQSGVSTWIANNLEFFEHLPRYVIIPALVTIVSVFTEFSSNAATATLILPIFAELALSINVHPLLLLIPATFASNYAFILPSGTPPNAMAFGTGYVNVNDMAFPGLFMHVMGILLLSVLTHTLGSYVFGDLSQPASALPWLGS